MLFGLKEIDMNSWIVIFPPLLVIFTALLTRRMNLAFLVGIIFGALIATNYQIYASIKLIFERVGTSSGLTQIISLKSIISSWSLLIFLFLICIGILIQLLSQTGSAKTYVESIIGKIHSKRSAELTSLTLSSLLFIDDYFSALTVGSVMRPLAQGFQIPILKIAFLTTVMAAPMAILSPVSSWVGEIILQIKQVGISSETGNIILADPFYVFIKTIPFIVYALLAILTGWYIVLREISYGPIGKLEQKINESFDKLKTYDKLNFGCLFNFVFPIILLIATIFIGLLFTGNYFLFGGTNGLSDALKNCSVNQALGLGGLLTVIISFAFYLICNKLTFSSAKKCMFDGIKLMFPSIVMLTLAWSLGAILKNDLHTGSYIAEFFKSTMKLSLLPLISFIFAGFITWMIGSSWATIGLMLPIVIDILKTVQHFHINSTLEMVPMLFPLLGATLSGAVMGSHISLLSDNPIMTSASTGADHFEHIKTMSWYIAPAIITTGWAYALIGITIDSCGIFCSYLIGFISAFILTIVFLELAHYVFNKNKKVK